MATTDTVPRPADGDPGRTGRGHLRIRRDRAVILLAGCAALLAALVTAVVAPFSAAVSWPWPVFLLLLGIGSVLSLRYLAVQDRAARRGEHLAEPLVHGAARELPCLVVHADERVAARDAGAGAQFHTQREGAFHAVEVDHLGAGQRREVAALADVGRELAVIA